MTQDDLTQFIGTEKYYRWSALFPNFLLTDGAHYVAEQAGAYWLMDAIASHLKSYKDAGFAIVVFGKDATQEGGGFTLRIVDDIPSTKVYATQKIEYSDFPLDEIKLYVIYDGTHWTILLPSEY
jgi:hypothetical protein